jgi:hypothetical protein
MRKGTKVGITRKRAYILLALIVLFGTILSSFLFKGMSFYGDDFAYVGFLPQIFSSTFKSYLNIFSLRLMLLFPIAFFVKMFGYTDLGAGAYALVCYIVSIVLVFLLGKEFKGYNVGLLSALLFAIYPATLHYNTEPNPMLPLVMLLTLAVLLFVYGKKFNNKWLYALSGISTFMGALVNPLAYLYILFFGTYIVVDFIYGFASRNRPHYQYLMYFIGVATAIVILGFVNLHITQNANPFYEFQLTNSYYSAAGGPDQIYYTNPSLSFYIGGYFPYSFNSLGSLFDQVFNFQYLNLNDVGFFSYFVVLAGAYLLAIKSRRRYLFLLGWAAFLVVYMEFGTMSITHYFPIYKLTRFTMVVAAPLMLVLGAGLIELKERLFKRKELYGMIVIGAVVVFLFATSITMDYYYYILNYNTTMFSKLIAQALLSAPNLSNSTVYGSALTPWYFIYYMGFPAMRGFGQYGSGQDGTTVMPTCASIPNNTYLLIPDAQALTYINSLNLWNINESWAFNPSECNLTLYANIYNNSLVNGKYYYLAYTGNLYYKS